jgi:hypothetical protein
MTISATPSRAISTAWASRGWCDAKRRRSPAAAAPAFAAPDQERAAALIHWVRRPGPPQNHDQGA